MSRAAVRFSEHYDSTALSDFRKIRDDLERDLICTTDWHKISSIKSDLVYVNGEIKRLEHVLRR